MKKITLLLTAALFTTAAFSQMSFNYGITAGANITTLTEKSTGGSIPTTSYKAGLHAGVFGELGVGNGFIIQPQITYDQMGGKLEEVDEAGDPLTVNGNYDYLSIPVLVKYNISSVEGLNVFLGPQVGFLMGAKFKAQGESLDIKDITKTVDFLGKLGVGYNLSMGIGFTASYQYGFVNVFKDENIGNAVNNGFTIAARYTFSGKKK